MRTVIKSMTEHLTIAELLGGVSTYGQLPNGWVHPQSIADVAIGSKPYIKNLKTRDWELAEVLDYWEMGRFLQVRCGKRLQMIFTREHIAVRGNK